MLTDEVKLRLSSRRWVEDISTNVLVIRKPKFGQFVACGIRNDGIWNPEFSIQVIRDHTNYWKWNPSSAVKESESSGAQRWDEMLILITMKLKVNYHVLVKG